VTRRLALTLAVVLLLACGSALVAAADSGGTGGPGPAVSAVGPGDDAGQSASLSELQEPPDTDATVTRIRVLPNGTAEWSLTIRMQLDSEEAEERFAAFEEEFAANRSTFVDNYREPRVDAISDAENLTGREMTATGFDAETGTEAVVRERGFVTYQYRWVGFAPVEDGVVRAGDVFESGLFVEENGILVVESPDGYEVTTVEPEPDETGESELRWEGPVSFSDRRPSVAFAPSDDPGDTTDGTADDTPGDTTADGDDSPGDDGSDGGLSTGPVLFGTAGIAVLIGAGAFYLHRRRQHPDPEDTPAAGDVTDGVATGSETATGAEAATDSDEMPDLATDEDRVLAALEAEDGRMKQSELADQLDWSPSKTSRVLSDMADEGEIEKLRIGRENVIDLADDE
jgi:hypothetical protein